jgi:hypothetical protein
MHISHAYSLIFELPSFGTEDSRAEGVAGPYRDVGELVALKNLHFRYSTILSIPPATIRIAGFDFIFDDSQIRSFVFAVEFTEGRTTMHVSLHVSFGRLLQAGRCISRRFLFF